MLRHKESDRADVEANTGHGDLNTSIILQD